MPTRRMIRFNSRRVRSRSVGIEVRERLVEEEHARPRRERARERHALLLSAGELRDPAVLEPGEVHGGERLRDPLALAAPRDSPWDSRPKATFSPTVMWGKSA